METHRYLPSLTMALAVGLVAMIVGNQVGGDSRDAHEVTIVDYH